MAGVNDVPTDDATRDTFVRLSGLIYAEAGEAAIHQSIVDAAHRLVDGCERSSLMLRQRGQFLTAAATDDIARGSTRSRARNARDPASTRSSTRPTSTTPT